VVVSKFAWHLPLNRQTQMLAGQGVHLDRSTPDRVDRAAWWLEGLYDLQLKTIHSFPHIFCDETPMPVLQKGRRRTRKCQLWAHAVDDRPWQGPAAPAVVLCSPPAAAPTPLQPSLAMGSPACCRSTAMRPIRRW
jgi:hypothetical protein